MIDVFLRARVFGFGLLVLSQTFSLATAVELSDEGNVRRDAHEFLINEFMVDRKTKIRDAGDDRVLQEMVVSEPQVVVTDKLEIPLPEGAQRVAGMFRHLAIRGKHLLRVKSITLKPFASDSKLHHSEHRDDFYRVQVASMPLPKADLEPISLLIECEGEGESEIDTIEFHSQNKLFLKFDDIPFRNLGTDSPREKVAVVVDREKELSIGGHVELDRSKFFRYYAAPGSAAKELEEWAHERNFKPGRQIYKMEPALVKGYSKTQPLLTELEGQPGKPDLSVFEDYDANAGLERAIEPFRSIDYAMCLDEWPAFMSRHPGGRGTPKIEHFDDAAELAAAFIEDQKRDAGVTAKWWEVKNESSIKPEWDYHWSSDYDSWGLLADFHNRVADRIKARSPDVKVGGPTSAWMQLQAGSFGLYRNQRKFMDLTRDHLDFYSHHFYEDFGTVGAYERRQGRYTNYLLGRFEASIDMLVAHMHGTDNVKPILITECGSLQPGRNPSDNWLRLRAYNAYVIKAMQRPEQIDLIVPFIFLNVPWDPASGDAAFVPVASEGEAAAEPIKGDSKTGKFKSTDVAYFFDLWRDFAGRRVWIQHEQDFLDAVAVRTGDEIMVALTNMGGKRLSVDLSSVLGGQDGSVTQRRMRYYDGLVVYEDEISGVDAAAIPVDVEETSIVRFQVASASQAARSQAAGKIDAQDAAPQVAKLHRWFAGPTAVSSDALPQQQFEITIEDEDLLAKVSDLRLKVGVHQEGGLKNGLQVTINGTSFATSPRWAVESNHLFAPIEIKLSAKHLRAKNEIRIASEDGLTVTSVHLQAVTSQD